MTARPMTARDAFDLYQVGRHAEAAALCERLVAADPRAIAAWHVLGVARLTLGSILPALDALDHALALDPARAGVLSGRALALVTLERFDDGLLACAAALAADPNNPTVLNARGVALRRLEALPRRWRPMIAPWRCRRVSWTPCAIAAGPCRTWAGSTRPWRLTTGPAPPRRTFPRPWPTARRCCCCWDGRPRPRAIWNGWWPWIRATPRALGDLLHARRQVCDWRDDATLLAAIRRELEAGRLAISPFAALSAFDDPALHHAVARLSAPARRTGAGLAAASAGRPDPYRLPVGRPPRPRHRPADGRDAGGPRPDTVRDAWPCRTAQT